MRRRRPPPSRIMQVTHMRELAIAVLFLATGPASAWAQPARHPRPQHTRSKRQAKTSPVDAPIGHRQPSVNDLPPSLRQKEETGFERSRAAASPGTRHACPAKAGKAGRPRAVRGAADRHLADLPGLLIRIDNASDAAHRDGTCNSSSNRVYRPPRSDSPTTACWPRSSLIRCAMMRPATSLGPPAANGTTRVRGRVGQLCATAGCLPPNSVCVRD